MTGHPSQPGADEASPAPRGLLAIASWRNAALLVIAITTVRLLFLIFVSPYELAADEAQYWDWSRRLDLSYYSKGPGVAWVIAASTRVFGQAEWAIRIPAVLSAAVTMLAVMRMAKSMSGGSGKVAFLAVVAFLAAPVYHGAAILMTIDAPYIACWALAALAFWEIARRGAEGGGVMRWWLALGAALGVGFLFKYTIVLLIPGMVGYALWGASGLRGRPRAPGALVACATFGVIAAPVVIWNQQNGWPTLAHLLGHLGAPGGDVPARGAGTGTWSYNPLWTLSFVGSQIGLIGPLLVAMALSVAGLRRRARSQGQRDEATAVCVWLATPILLFYLAVSLVTDAEGNWPIAGYVTLLAPVARWAEIELPRWHAMVDRWRGDPARPREGMLRRRPETAFQVAWHWAVGFGVVAGVGVFLLAPLSRAALIGPYVPYHRLSGHRAFAVSVADAAAAAGVSDATGRFLVADRYTTTALLAYYFPGRPSVRSAASYLGSRRSSYDYFADTSLVDPALIGKSGILVGARPERWERVLSFRGGVMELLAPTEGRPGVYLGRDYQGTTEAGADQPDRANP